MTISGIAIKRNVLTYVMMIILVVFGLMNFGKLGLALLPEMDQPVVTITTILVGASPEIIETSVTNKIEEKIATLSGIDFIKSNSAYSYSVIVVTFEMEIDPDKALQDVREALGSISQDLPSDCEFPTIKRVDLGASSVISLALMGDYDIGELTYLAKNVVKEEVQQVAGVGTVDTIGGREREIRVWLNIDALEKYQIGINEVSRAFMLENVEIPGGTMETDTHEYLVSTKGQLKSISALKKMVITHRNGQPIYLSQIAEVGYGLEEKRTSAFQNGLSCIALQVKKQSGVNEVEVANAVKALIPTIQMSLPEGVELIITDDSSQFIKATVQGSLEELFLGAGMAVLITFFFLHNIRSTMLILIVLPSILIAAFFFLYQFGFALNTVTMLALSLSIGIIVDDAIVMIENMWRHLEMGKTPMQAALDGSGEIAFAVVSISSCILGVFIPIAFVTGLVGKFFFQLGMTMGVVVLLSLLFTLTVTPTLASRILREPSEKKNWLVRQIVHFLDALDGVYKRILTWALQHRYVTMALGIAVLGISLLLIQQVPMELVQEQDRSAVIVEVKADAGTKLSSMETYVSSLEQKIQAAPEIKNIYSTIGADVMKSVNKAQITVNLVGIHYREASQNEVRDRIRSLLSRHIEENRFPITITVQGKFIGGGSIAPIELQVVGPELTNLQTIVHRTKEEWQTIPGFSDIESSLERGNPELQIYPIRESTSQSFVNVVSIATTVYALIGGQRVSTFEEKGENYDVVLQLEKSDRSSKMDLSRLKVQNNLGRLIDFSTLVRVEEGEAPAQIDHHNRQRAVTLKSNIAQGYVLGQVLPHATETLQKNANPYGPRYQVVTSGLGKLMNSSISSLGSAMLLAILMIILIMAAQFNSFVYPFSIVLAVPFAASGAFIGLWIGHASVNLMSMLGMLLLMGLVVKTSILLISFTNEQRDQGIPKHEALLKAGPLRLRPILMTAFAMIFAMIPVALGSAEGSELRVPMGVTIIGGLITATVLTLVVVPVAYSLIDDFTSIPIIRWLRRNKNKEAVSKPIQPIGNQVPQDSGAVS